MQYLSNDLDPVNLVKILLVGKSGVGKTYTAAGADGLWYFTHEADGVPVVKARNPSARVWVLDETIEDYGNMKGVLVAPHRDCSGAGCAECRHTGLQAAADGCRMVVYDSLTEAQRICLSFARQKGNKVRENKLEEHMADKLEYQYSYYYLARLLSAFRSIRLPLVVLAHSEEPEPVINVVGGGQQKLIKWYVPGKKFDAQIPRFFTAIGTLHHDVVKDERGVVFDPSVVWDGHRFASKMAAGLRQIESANPNDWLKNMSAAMKGDGEPLQPLNIEFTRSSPITINTAQPEPEKPGLTRHIPQ